MAYCEGTGESVAAPTVTVPTKVAPGDKDRLGEKVGAASEAVAAPLCVNVEAVEAVAKGEKVRPDELDPDELLKGEEEAVAPIVLMEDRDGTLLAVAIKGEEVPMDVSELVGV